MGNVSRRDECTLSFGHGTGKKACHASQEYLYDLVGWIVYNRLLAKNAELLTSMLSTMAKAMPISRACGLEQAGRGSEAF
jgi:hypothetical protein